jgi:hypothetical protein
MRKHREARGEASELSYINYSTLSEGEQALYRDLDSHPLAQAEAAVRLSALRGHRLLIKITRAEEALASSDDGLELTSTTLHKGWNVAGKVDFSDVERRQIFEKIMRLEDVLTRVSGLHLKAIQRLSEEMRNSPPDSGGLEAIVAAIDRSAAARARAGVSLS